MVPAGAASPVASSAPAAPANNDGFWDEIKSAEKTPQEIYAAETAKKEPPSPAKATSYAIDRLARGAAPARVFEELRQQGVGPEESERIVEELQEGRKGGGASHNSKVGMAFWGLSVPGVLNMIGGIVVCLIPFVRETDQAELIGLIIIGAIVICLGLGSLMTSVMLQNRVKAARYVGFMFAILYVCSCSIPSMVCGVCALISLSSGDMTEYLNEE